MAHPRWDRRAPRYLDTPRRKPVKRAGVIHKRVGPRPASGVGLTATAGQAVGGRGRPVEDLESVNDDRRRPAPDAIRVVVSPIRRGEGASRPPARTWRGRGAGV